MTRRRVPTAKELWNQVRPVLRRRQTWITLVLLAILIGLSLIREPLFTFIDRGWMIDVDSRTAAVREWVQSFGYWAPVAYIALFAAQILVAPLPGHFMGMLGGYLFGVLRGSVYSLVGLALGAGMAAALARYLGQPVIRRLVGEEQMEYWERRLRMNSPLTWWLIFLFPVPDTIYYVAGLSGVPLRWLLVAVLAGRGPGLVVGNWVGDRAATLPYPVIGVIVILLILVVPIVYRHYASWGATILDNTHLFDEDHEG